MAAGNQAVPSIKQLVADPDFRKLPGKDKISVISQLDQDFAGLPLDKQSEIVSQAINLTPMGPKTKGFGEQATDFAKTLGSDVVGAAGTALRLSPPGMALDIARGKKTAPEEIVGAQVGQFKEAGKLAREGRFVESAGHAAAGTLPLVGPLAAETGEEVGEGDYGKAAAHGLELLAPSMRGAAKPLARGAKGAAGAVQAVVGAASDVAGLPVIRNIPFVRNLRGMLDDIAGRNPRMSPGQLAHDLYKEVNGRAPKTPTEKIEAVRMYREALKGKSEPPAPKPAKIPPLGPRISRFDEPPPAPKHTIPPLGPRISRFDPPPPGEEEIPATQTQPPAYAATAAEPPHARSQVLQARGEAKRNYLAARFENAGITPEQVERMSDADLERHILEEGESLKARGAIKSAFKKYDPNNAANTPYKIMKLEIAKAMRVRAAAKSAGSAQ